MKYTNIAVACGLILVANPGHAGDGKVYPGMMCQESTGLNSSLQYHLGGVYNLSATKNVSASCPIVRDKTHSTSITAKVVLTNPGIVGAFSCRVTGRATDGSFYYGPTNNEWQEGRVFTKDLGASADLLDKMALYIDCRIPSEYGDAGPSAISSYQVVE